MSAPVHLRRFRWLLACSGAFGVVVALGAKPITPPGPGGFRVSPPASVHAEAGDIDSSATAPQFATAPSPLPPNLANVRFETAGVAELGDLIRLDGSGHFIGSVSIAMSTGALRSDWPGSAPYGFTHPVTLSLYLVDRSGGTPRPGPLLARMTESFLIPWRAEPDPAATNLPGRPWRAADGQLYTGRAFTLTFDVGSLGLALPDEIVFGVSFNTQHFGSQPLGVAGPYDALGVAVTEQPSGVGQDVEPDALFLKTTLATGYTDGGTAGVNLFRSDGGWTPFRPAIRVTNSNYGALFANVTRLDGMRSSDRDLQGALRAARAAIAMALDRGLWDGNQRLDPGYGGYLFDMLADASEDLAYFAASADPHAPEAQDALNGLIDSTVTLAETAIADAIILGGGPRQIYRAQNAADQAGRHEANEAFGNAIDSYGLAWREAQEAVR